MSLGSIILLGYHVLSMEVIWVIPGCPKVISLLDDYACAQAKCPVVRPGEMTTCIYHPVIGAIFIKKGFLKVTHIIFMCVLGGFTMQWCLGLGAISYRFWMGLLKGDCILIINFIQLFRTELKSRSDLQSIAFCTSPA